MSTLLPPTSAKHDFRYIKRCITLSPKPSNIATVFEPTVNTLVRFPNTEPELPPLCYLSFCMTLFEVGPQAALKGPVLHSSFPPL